MVRAVDTRNGVIPLSITCMFRSPEFAASSGKRLRQLRRVLPAFLLFYAVTVALQWRGGAYQSEFGDGPDESSHYVTGLMVRDYIAALAPASPMTYARNYYLHYPKVALGHWPPFFYLVQALWTLPFSGSRTSFFLLAAVLTALLAVTLCEVIRRYFSAKAGMAIGLLLISIPLVETQSRTVMAEILVALLVFWGTLCWGEYLDRPGWSCAAWFGIWSSLAVLTKGTGLVLALVPVMSLLLTRRFRLVAKLSFWLPAIMVLVLCGPWYLLAPGARHESFIRYGGLGFTLDHLRRMPRDWLQAIGIALVPFAVIGLAAWLVRFRRERNGEGTWISAVSLLISIAAFRWVVAVSTEFRHMSLALPAVLMFVGAGVATVLAWRPLAGIAARRKGQALAAAFAIVFSMHAFRMPPKTCHGFSELAEDLLARSELRNSVFLVSSDATGEGMFIAEVAMREKRPGHIVLRASKMLASSDWMGRRYRLRYQTATDQMRFLEEIPAGIVVIDLSAHPESEHQRLLRRTIQAYPERWELAGSFPHRAGPARKVVAYRLLGHETRPAGKIHIEMEFNLKRSIDN